jgi:hypothetical protein
MHLPVYLSFVYLFLSLFYLSFSESADRLKPGLQRGAVRVVLESRLQPVRELESRLQPVRELGSRLEPVRSFAPPESADRLKPGLQRGAVPVVLESRLQPVRELVGVPASAGL